MTCNYSKETEIKKSKFIIETAVLQNDTIIRSAVFLKNYIICLQANDKFLLLAKIFKRIDSLAERLNKINPVELVSFNDSIIVVTNKKSYLLTEDLALTEYSFSQFRHQFPLYIDSTYYVYGCCVGEWGGSVFFLNKKNNKTYSYPATCVSQVLKFEDNYIVCNNLYSTNFISIKDPSKLFELKDERQKTNCNWYIEVNSVKNGDRVNSILPDGVVKYTDSSKTRYLHTLMTFKYEGDLYSVVSADSLTLLEKHTKFNLVVTDTLRKQKTISDYEKTFFIKGVGIMAYMETWSSGTSNEMTNYASSGLILIRNNRIKFLELKMPHSWANEGKK